MFDPSSNEWHIIDPSYQVKVALLLVQVDITFKHTICAVKRNRNAFE